MCVMTHSGDESSHETRRQYRLNAGPASQTLAQHWAGTGSISRGRHGYGPVTAQARHRLHLTLARKEERAF